MNTAVMALQAMLRARGKTVVVVNGTFDAVTSNAMWAAWRAGDLNAADPTMVAARAEVCGAFGPNRSPGPWDGLAGQTILLGGKSLPLPPDVPLWVVPYNLHQLKHGLRQQTIVQAILHHDAAGSAEQCFRVLKARGLSTHFAVDDCGLVLQFLDPLVNVAWHAMGEVRREDGSSIEHGFNFRSIGIDLSNPVDPATAAGRADAGRELVTQKIHGRDLTRLDFYACQEEAGLALLKVLHARIPSLGTSYRPDAVWKGDLTRNTPGIFGHYHVAKGKIDPFGFPMNRLAEVAAGTW